MIENMVSSLLSFFSWIVSHPLDAADIAIMLLSLIIVFLCRYPSFRDATVGTALIISWVYQIYETANGYRISAPSDVLFDAMFFLIVLSASGNIMSVVVFDGLHARWTWFKSLFRWKHENKR